MIGKKININWSEVSEYLQAGCSGVEIASKLGIHENTLYQRCRTDLNVEFMAYSQQKRASGEALLKKTQFDMAVIDKDRSMLIWLGKNRLGQTDKQQTNVNVNEAVTGVEVVIIDNKEQLADLERYDRIKEELKQLDAKYHKPNSIVIDEIDANC